MGIKISFAFNFNRGSSTVVVAKELVKNKKTVASRIDLFIISVLVMQVILPKKNTDFPDRIQ